MVSRGRKTCIYIPTFKQQLFLPTALEWRIEITTSQFYSNTSFKCTLCLQDTSNSQQMKAEIMCTTRHLWLRGSCRCDTVSTDHSVKAWLHGVFTIIRQAETEHLKHNVEPFLNSGSIPLSSQTQLTTWYLLHAHALHLYKCETGQNIHVSSTTL